ncbi:hypothetical protein RvY_01783 [Ramazzottius varieornatus]|uniref:Uncharacterized protein n=1 Tax=Ramazzottius varieornatus TaxID=947166 RepID=A0A1D1ULD5_RAMVA|nr:hypothetical protein RvY_01783 [Ramazzottius varieornatus]
MPKVHAKRDDRLSKLQVSLTGRHKSATEPEVISTREETSATYDDGQHAVVGWTSQQICTMIMYAAKAHGTSNATVDRFMAIFSLVINTPRHASDVDKRIKFPTSAKSMGIFLGLKPPNKQHVVYICPEKKEFKKKGNKRPSYEICGYTLTVRNEGPNRTYVCEVCNIEWDRKRIEKDGNCFSAQPLHELLTSTMQRYGKFCSSQTKKFSGKVLRYVCDGQRWLEMNPADGDLVISLWANTASVSESTSRKMEDSTKGQKGLPVFLKEQLRTLQLGNDGFRPVLWTSIENMQMSSGVSVHSIWADSSERTALNGHLSHSAGKGCTYSFKRDQQKPQLIEKS